MFTVLLRKMRNTKWMVLCLILGFLMAAGMMSTVPIYMDASLQRVLIKEMEQYQIQSGSYPGKYIVSADVPLGVTAENQLAVLDKTSKMVKNRIDRIGIPVENSKVVVSDNLLFLVHGTNASNASSTHVRITAMSGIEDHIDVFQGELYNESGIAEDGSYQVIVTEEAAKALGIVCGSKYLINPVDTSRESFYITVAGFFTQSAAGDSYWSEDLIDYAGSVFIPFSLSEKLIGSGLINIVSLSVNYNLNYHSVNMNDISNISENLQSDFAFYSEKACKFEMGSADIISSYVKKASSLTAILWAIQIPTMIMLAFYLFMVSQLNIERERNEIAVLKSRGAKPLQIFSIYSMEMAFLGLVTLLTAPFIGLLLCKFLGVSNGFMEFVNRSGIAAKLSVTAFIYALAAVLVFFITTMIPIIPASKLTIVEYKQSKTKIRKTALWEICGIDIILIGLSVTFYFLYTHFTNEAISKGTFEATGQIDPLIFVFSSCLILGLGLFFVRIYPYILKLIYIAGKLLWTPAQYMALTSVSCAGGSKERFLMLFLILTFSYGIFSANTARAINNNKSDMIFYQNGADIVITEYWPQTEYYVGDVKATVYQEPDFSKYQALTGVESAAKVLYEDNAKLYTSGSSANTRPDGGNEEADDRDKAADRNDNAPSKQGNKKGAATVKAMAIDPIRFAKTAWFRDDLLPIQWQNYCNALNRYSEGVIISSSLANDYNLKMGDEVNVSMNAQDRLPVTVVAVVDYWPGINPNSDPKYFCIVNYSYISANCDLKPYSVWVKLADDAKSETLYAEIKEQHIPIETFKDSTQMLIAEKNNPSLQGLNGGLTLGFIITMIMSVIGFLIYWILSIKGRTLQFGILRAMGMSLKEIIAMLGYEQILVSLSSIVMAFVIGGITGDIYVPFFQNMYRVDQQIPPFIVSASAGDYIKIYILIAVMLIGGFLVLGNIIKKININKALKLGED